MRAQRNLIATPRPRFSFQGCQQVGSEEPAAVALMNPQALDSCRTTPRPATVARSQLAVLVTNGGEDLKPVMNVGGGEVEGGDLITELIHDCPIGLVEHRNRPERRHWA